jgi:hypothetical protein
LQTLREPDWVIGGLDGAAAQLEVKRTTLLAARIRFVRWTVQQYLRQPMRASGPNSKQFVQVPKFCLLLCCGNLGEFFDRSFEFLHYLPGRASLFVNFDEFVEIPQRLASRANPTVCTCRVTRVARAQ